MSTQLKEVFMTPQELINLANQEIERKEVQKTTKVTTMEEAIGVMKESMIVYFY